MDMMDAMDLVDVMDSGHRKPHDPRAANSMPAARRSSVLHDGSRPPQVQRFALRVDQVHSVHHVQVTARRAKRALDV
jgi:hypothetical protein